MAVAANPLTLQYGSTCTSGAQMSTQTYSTQTPASLPAAVTPAQVGAADAVLPAANAASDTATPMRTRRIASASDHDVLPVDRPARGGDDERHGVVDVTLRVDV